MWRIDVSSHYTRLLWSVNQKSVLSPWRHNNVIFSWSINEYRADSEFGPSQWETSLQSNAVSHWLGPNLESALCIYPQIMHGSASRLQRDVSAVHARPNGLVINITFTGRIYTYTAKCSLQWSHNGCDGVSNHQPHHCLLNRLFRRRSKKTPKLRVTGLCAGNSPVTDGQQRRTCFHLMTSLCAVRCACSPRTTKWAVINITYTGRIYTLTEKCCQHQL